MTVEGKLTGDTAVVVVNGRLMGGPETKVVHNKVKSMLRHGIKKFIINISKVKWLNSSGLNLLLSCMTSIQKANGTMKIAGATERVNNLFMMTKLKTVFDTYKSVDRAVASFK